MAEINRGVAEQERLKAFFDSVQKVKDNADVKIPVREHLALFDFMLKNGSLPDTLRKRIQVVLNTALYEALVTCENHLAPKQREYTVDVNVAPTSFSMKVKATSKEEAEELVQRTIDDRSLDADTVLSVTNAVLSSVEALEANDGQV